MKFMEATCLSEELGRLKKKKKKNAWESSESSRFAYRGHSAIQAFYITVRLVDLEYSQLHKKA